MQVLYAGMAVAAALGLTTGGVMRVDPYAPGDRPRGPQQIFSQPQAYGVHDAFAYTGAVSASNPYADYVIGTDWLPGGRYDRPYRVEAFRDESIEEMKARLYAKYDIPNFEPPPLETEPAPDRTGKEAQIVLADHQAGGQVNDASHWSNPDALVSEPAG